MYILLWLGDAAFSFSTATAEHVEPRKGGADLRFEQSGSLRTRAPNPKGVNFRPASATKDSLKRAFSIRPTSDAPCAIATSWHPCARGSVPGKYREES